MQTEFRGIRKDGKGWVKGWLVELGDSSYIFNEPDYCEGVYRTIKETKHILALCGMVVVIPETVGQWTGKLDKEDVKIFAGSTTIDTRGNIEIVEWLNNGWILRSDHSKYKGWRRLVIGGLEVTGTIHDHLLEVKK